MAQDVGPILEMVTEKYLLRAEAEWLGRLEAIRLFDHITALSPPRSRLATEFLPTMDAFSTDDGRWQRYGFSDDLAGLVYPGERSHVIEYLQGLGWDVTGRLVPELFEAYGIEYADTEVSEQFEGYQYVSARLG